ncbi:hypothetical protein [Novosphingobium sp. 9U]|uniref:hypothetical protein n=1 Tax=Novosphingobium sp. 9U TaxID=2653158 RepID=UPI0012F40566|nr:hypothetical protein [Novosphingobium sp. 9U]VWX54792.1 conserved hypothetical protein [Novosphingobium sp. 9U]
MVDESLHFATGDTNGVRMPACPRGLRQDPQTFLTQAFRAYGVLPATGEVLAVEHIHDVTGGNSGQKLQFDVIYRDAPEGLPTRLFAKFSRDFDDAFRDRRRDELDGEIRLAALSRLPAFPVAVPRPVFGDFERASGTGLLITERIAFGEGAIEPLWPKCLDHLMPDPLAHYRALVSAQARLAASYHAGELSPQVEALFPFDLAQAQADLPVSYDAAALQAKVAAWLDFIAVHPQLFPEALQAAEWRERFVSEAMAIHAAQAQIRRFLYADPRLVALCHWNANVDNAWFWREADRSLACGLLDWGMVRPMNVAVGLWGGLSAGTTQFVTRELDGLLAHYCNELASHGGPRVTVEELGLHFDLALALVGLSLMMDLPEMAAARLPQIGNARGPLDPLIAADKVVQGFLLVSTNFLSLWEQRRFGRNLALAG